MELEVLAPKPIRRRQPDGPLTIGAADLPTAADRTWLSGKKLAIRAEWPSFSAFMQEIESIVRRDYGVADVAWWDLEAATTSPYLDGGRANTGRIDGIIDELAAGSDCGVFGLAN